jgi:hypothetical protein
LRSLGVEVVGAVGGWGGWGLGAEVDGWCVAGGVLGIGIAYGAIGK